LRASICARGGAADELAQRLLEDVLGFQEHDARDDVVVVVVRVPPAALVSPGSSC
jgi:serine phosphatase RsbU (regulator of sigma subunit)